ncbi:hypothetical protein [Stratiformator vulcanicus]|uniref:OstA-like protein n=1 Tax=Stratiformator vulcanicus TaxID=2527980 RepID=A0A517QYG5_9PLAN|nr:hypothetical protein [Stratiformator vulcanicus]QDT36681.1 OstA-like protein [Stratiformator vulcanicus]
MSDANARKNSSGGLKFAAFTLGVTAIICGLSFGYAHLTRPLFEFETPEPIGNLAGTSTAPAPQPSHNRRSAEQFLEDEPWAQTANYQLRNDQAVLFTNAWETVEDDHAIRMRPFAMILQGTGGGENGGEDTRPITVTAASAYLRFQGAVRIADSNPGRIQFGALEGPVTIRGKDGLLISGSNFAFDEQTQKIWSDERIEFQYGPHHGKGRGVEIDLFRAGPAEAFETVAFSGLGRIHVRREVDTHLATTGTTLPGTDAAATTDRKTSEEATDESSGGDESDKPIRVVSDGPFEFDPATNVASFSENVRVYRPVDDGAPDTLHCNTLTIELSPKDDESEEAAQRRREELANLPPGEVAGQPVDPGLSPQKLIAVGSPLAVSSPTNDTKIFAETATYDVANGTLVFDSSVPVRVLRGPSLLTSGRVVVRHTDSGSFTDIDCLEGGSMRQLDPETGELDFDARWKDQMNVRNGVGGEGQLTITMIKDVLVRRPGQQFALAGQTVTMYADSVEGDPSDALISDASAPIDEESTSNFEPSKMVARDQVSLISPQLLAQTDLLEVDFVPAADPVASPPRPLKPDSGRRLEPLGGLLQNDRNIGFASVADSPTNVAAPRQAQRVTALKPSDEPLEDPYRMVADKIVVTVERKPNSSSLDATSQGEDETEQSDQIRKIVTTGHVQMWKKRPDNEEFRIIGDQLIVRRQPDGTQLADVMGKPAHVRDRGAHIQADMISLDRGANRAWVDGAGLLELPVKQSSSGAELDEPGRLDVWWTESMNFDGREAHFVGEVRTIMDDDRLICSEMTVRLTERISFAENGPGLDGGGPLGGSSQKSNSITTTSATAVTGNESPIEPADDSEDEGPQVESIVCTRGVEVDGYEFEEGVQKGTRRAKFWEFQVDNVTGKTTAKGPGWVKLWRRGERDRANLSVEATVVANTTVEKNEANWEFTRVDFSGNMSGRIGKNGQVTDGPQTATFHGGVQILYGPVPDGTATIEPEALPPEGGWMRCRSLQVTQKKGEEGKAATIELLAAGNAELEGRSFYARADTISYDESKEMYILRSLGDRWSTIWRQAKIGGKYSRADARTFKFIPSKNHLVSDQTRALDGLR